MCFGYKRVKHLHCTKSNDLKDFDEAKCCICIVEHKARWSANNQILQKIFDMRGLLVDICCFFESAGSLKTLPNRLNEFYSTNNSSNQEEGRAIVYGVSPVSKKFLFFEKKRRAMKGIWLFVLSFLQVVYQVSGQFQVAGQNGFLLAESLCNTFAEGEFCNLDRKTNTCMRCIGI